MTDPAISLNQLEALALLYAGHSNSNSIDFADYIDTRFENTFNVHKRATLKAMEVDVLGPDVSGIVLDPNAGADHISPKAGFQGELPASVLAALGITRPNPTATCRVMVLGSPHTTWLRTPATYGSNQTDRDIIKSYPAFVYAPATFPLVPGSFVGCRFDKGTYQSGIVTSVDTTMSPFILGGESSPPLSSLSDFGRASDLGAVMAQELDWQSAPDYILPLRGVETATVASAFAHRFHPITGKPQHHYGLDIPGAARFPLVAIADGEVMYTRNGTYSDTGGYFIVIKYEDKITGGDLYSRYLHMASPTHLKKGDKVTQGDTVGYMGTTGISTGVHLHFELAPLRHGSDPGKLRDHINPVSYYPANSFVDRSGNAVT